MKLSLRAMSRILAVSCLSFLAACGESGLAETSKGYLESAQKDLANRDFQSAVIQLKNAIQLNSDDPAARRLLGEAYVGLNALPQAEKELERAWKLGDQSNELRLELVRVKRRLGAYAEVIELTNSVNDHDFTTSPGLMVERGAALIGTGKRAEGTGLLEQANKEKPNSIALLLLAHQSSQKGERDAALTNAKQAIAADENNIGAHLFYGRLLLSDGHLMEARDVFERANNLAPQQVRTVLALTAAEIELGNIEKASKLVEKALNGSVRHPLAQYQSAVIALRNGKFDDARTKAEAVLALDPRYPPALLVAGTASANLKRFELAREYLSKYLGERPDDEKAIVLNAWVNTQLGNYDAAYDGLLHPALADNNSDLFLQLAMTSAMQTGERVTAKEYSERYVDARPDDPMARSVLAELRWMTGDREGAIDELQELIQQDPSSSEKLLQLAVALLTTQQYDKAKEVAKKLIEKFPDDAIGYTVEGVALARQKRLTEAEKSLVKALELEPGHSLAARNLATLKQSQGELAVAAGVLNAALSNDPDDVRMLRALAKLEGTRGNWDEAERLLKHAGLANPDSIQTRVDLARLYFFTKQADLALIAAKDVLALDPKNAAATETAGMALSVLGEHSKAADRFQELTELRPNQAQPHFQAGQSLVRAQRLPEAVEAYQSALSADPGFHQARVPLIRLLILLEQDSRARHELERLERDFPQNADVFELRGWYHLSIDVDPTKAVEAYRQAVELDKNTVRTLKLARVLSNNGKQDEALQILRSWLTEQPEDVLALKDLADLSYVAKDYPAAREYFAKLTDLQPKNASHFNNLAMIHLELDQPEKAQPFSEKALQLAPESPSVLDTAGLIAQRLEDFPAAIERFGAAMTHAPKDPSLRFRHAQALYQDGRLEKAERALQELLDENERFEGINRAKSLLKEVQAAKQ